MGILDLFRQWQDHKFGRNRVRRRNELARTEVLEMRRVLTPVVSFAAGTLTINASSLAATPHTFLISNSATSVSVTIDGGAPVTNSPVTKIIMTGSPGADTITLSGSFANLTSFTIAGGGGNDTLIAPNSTDIWNLTGANSGTLNNSYTTISFSAISNLQGGTGNNTFNFNGGTLTGNVNGGNGGGAVNTFNYASAPVGTPVIVNLTAATATDIGGTISNITTFVGNANTGDTLLGSNGSNVWTISGANSGKIVNTPPTIVPFTVTTTYSSFANITGGTGTNTYQFQNGGSVSGTLNGGIAVSGVFQPDWLDYSAVTTAVTVNLSTNTATSIGTVLNILGVHGSATAVNTLTGNSVGNVLVGGGGNDVLTAGSGRSLLIGGLGNDTVTGGTGQCILIAAYTAYDTNFTALSAILAEWKANDTFANRVAYLRNGGGYNGTYVLVANTLGATVYNDKGVNALYDGAGGPNWLWGQPLELRNKTASDLVDVPITVPPTLSITGTSNSIFTVGQGPVVVNSGISVSDPESKTIAYATVAITGNYNPAQDTLALPKTAGGIGNITSSFNSATGVLTLTSVGPTATIGNFTAALEQVTYSNSSSTPTTGTRTISFQINDGLAFSPVITSTVSINFAPVLSGATTSTFIPGGAPLVINPNATITDANNGGNNSVTTLLKATVQITAVANQFQQAQDVLSFTGNANTGSLYGTYNSATGTLTIQSSGALGTVAQYQAALRLVTFYNPNSTSNIFIFPRTISMSVFDGAASSNIITDRVNIFGYQFP